jgi:hypothetical protein
VGASVTSAGTGVQLETWVVGFKLGLEEGVEVHLFDLPLGVHFWPPGVTVPVNPGRIGIDVDTHRPATAHRDHSNRNDDEEREYGLASFFLWSRYARVDEPSDAGNLSDFATVGFDVRGAYGKTIGYGFGADLEAGVGFPLGFAYAARLYPTGLALMLGDNTFIGAFGGLGSNGVTSHVPARFNFASELRLEVDVVRALRLGSRATVAWYPGGTSRSGGSLVSPFADELVLSAFGRIGTAKPCGCPGTMGRGYFLAVELGEIVRSAWYGLKFGIEGDIGG